MSNPDYLKLAEKLELMDTVYRFTLQESTQLKQAASALRTAYGLGMRVSDLERSCVHLVATLEELKQEARK